MKHILLLFIVLVGVRTEAPAETRPGDACAASEIEQLRLKVEELERQNREMAQALAQVKAKLAGLPGNAPAPAAPAAREPVLWSEVIGEGRKARLYGFLRLDLDIDSQRPNNGQTPLFILPAESPGGARNFSMHPRLTRLGIDYTGPRVAGLRGGNLAGKLEVDFENGGSESRQLIRIRHAWFRMNWGTLSVLGGQTWDLFSPLFPTVNHDTLMWNAGNLGDRRPQLRVAFEPQAGRGQLSLTGGIGLTGAIDPVDLDQNGFRDGEQSGRPNVQSRLGYSRALWVEGRPFTIGASAFRGWSKTARPVAGRTVFGSQSVNLDYALPLSRWAALEGEGWWGRNMSEVRGGAGQGVSLLNGREIRGRGGWSELKLRASRYWSLNPGFTTDDPVDRDLPQAGRVRNRAFYLANRFTPGQKIEIGFDYLRWRTDYKGLAPATDNRFNIFFQYGF